MRRYTRVAAAAAAIAAALLLTAGACDPSNPTISSDSEHVYGGSPKEPTDTRIYNISGTVSVPVQSLTRQTEAGGGSISGYGGYVSGSFWGPIEKGKGFVRILVTASDAPLAPAGQNVLVKTTDTKLVAVLPGDRIRLKCRQQFEAIAAVQDSENYPGDRIAGTWELDFCRMLDPKMGVPTP